MENIVLLKLEIATFLLSFLYFSLYLLEKLSIIYNNIKNIIKPDKKLLIEKKNQLIELIKQKDDKIKNKIISKDKINSLQSQKISEILKKSRLNILKWDLDNARILLIEWLTIDKYSKDLNLELANIYEEQNQYKKAEYIYFDLLKIYENTFDILKRLWYNLAMQKRFEESMKVYIEADKKNRNDNEIIEILADLTYELKYYKKSLKYLKIFLKQTPRNTEKLKMKWYCYEVIWKVDEALYTYKKVIELQPYNNQVLEKIKHLEW